MGFFFNKRNNDVSKIEKELSKFMRENEKQLIKEETTRNKLTKEENIIRDIEQFFISVGFTTSDARESANNTLMMCKNKCKEEQTEMYSGIGRKVFALAENDNYLANCIKLARINGAKDTEIEAWWGLSDLERAVVQQLDEQTKLSAFIQYLDDGLSKEEASDKVKKYYAIYGYEEDNGNKKRAIPPELKSRVESFIRMMTSSETMSYSFNFKLEKYGNFNALVRSEWIDKGYE